ncbi:MAG: hypothetical protein CL607_09325 [Anaerolineaceae bacterium]|nr:hypothetical protein [Anaerolineaceae bacterium]
MISKSKNRPVPAVTKILVGLFLAFLVLNPVSVMLFTGLLTRFHDSIVMQWFAQPFFDYPLPDDTQEIGRDTFIVTGGSHGCGYVVERHLQSSLSKSELETYFRQTYFSMPFGEPVSPNLSMDGLLYPSVKSEGDQFVVTLAAGGFYTQDVGLIGCRIH